MKGECLFGVVPVGSGCVRAASSIQHAGGSAAARRPTALPGREHHADRFPILQRSLAGAANWRAGDAAGQPTGERAVPGVSAPMVKPLRSLGITTATRISIRYRQRAACPSGVTHHPARETLCDWSPERRTDLLRQLRRPSPLATALHRPANRRDAHAVASALRVLRRDQPRWRVARPIRPIRVTSPRGNATWVGWPPTSGCST